MWGTLEVRQGSWQGRTTCTAQAGVLFSNKADQMKRQLTFLEGVQGLVALSPEPLTPESLLESQRELPAKPFQPPRKQSTCTLTP